MGNNSTRIIFNIQAHSVVQTVPLTKQAIKFYVLTSGISLSLRFRMMRSNLKSAPILKSDLFMFCCLFTTQRGVYNFIEPPSQPKT